MTVVKFQNIYATRWLVFVQTLVKALDDGRAALVAHSSALTHGRPASSLLSTAQTAAYSLVAALSRRAGVFQVEHSATSGPVWDKTRHDYLGACGEILLISEALRFGVAVLLFDEHSSSLPADVSSKVLAHQEREFLDLGRELIVTKTRQVLDAAEHFMLNGGCSDLPGLSIDVVY
jgi:hypothetical protein